MRIRESIRTSSAWYLGVLGVGIIVQRFAGYLWYAEPVFKGQPANILLTFLAFGLAFVLWLVLGPRRAARGWFLGFLAGLSICWVTHVLIYRAHSDAYNYTAFLYVPVLIMIAFKPPKASEAWSAVLAYAWATSAVLVGTRVLEMTGVITEKYQTDGLIAFDTSNYWLPLNSALGIAGRWPGPFGHNGDTAMMGALIIIIAVARWTWASWVFLPVGIFTLLITSGRASEGAAVAGIVLLVMFSRSGFMSRIPQWIRLSGGGVLLLIGTYVLFAGKTGLTGRQTIWPAFIDLWKTSPWTGVGGSGIAVSGGITEQFGHAHSIYIDELVRNGLLVAVVQFAVLAIGLIIAAVAAGRGAPGPLAVLVGYFITGITEPRNNWIEPSVTGFLVVLMVVMAAAELKERPEGAVHALPAQ